MQESIRRFNSRGEEIPEDDFEAMEEIIDRWEDLKAVALDQQRQAKQVEVNLIFLFLERESLEILSGDLGWDSVLSNFDILRVKEHSSSWVSLGPCY